MDIENKLKYLRNEVAEAVNILAMCGDKTPVEQLGKKLCDAINNSAVPAQQVESNAAYEEVLASHRALVRELDALLNGDGAAKQASLCDVVGQVAQIVRETGRPLLQPSPAVAVPENCEACNRSKYAMATLRYILNLDQDSNKTLSETVTDIVNKYAAYPPIESSDAIIARAALKKLADLNAANFSTPSPRITDHPETILSNASQWLERITEQDAREIIIRYQRFLPGDELITEFLDDWISASCDTGCRTLLNKLNAKPETKATCDECKGLGFLSEWETDAHENITNTVCPVCHGGKLKPESVGG